MSKALENRGEIDILVAVAAAQINKPALSQTPDEIRGQINVNIVGTMVLIREVAKIMVEIRSSDDRDKAMVLIGSICSQGPLLPGGYGVSKTALRHMPEQYVAELGALGIRINTVGPGATDTPRTRREIDEYVDQFGSVTPLKRKESPIATPKDIARVVAAFLSEDFKFVTGQHIMVDGGHGNTLPLPQIGNDASYADHANSTLPITDPSSA